MNFMALRNGAVALGVLVCSFATAAHATCEDLAKFPLQNGKITSAVAVPANASIPLKLLKASIPAPAAFCRVAATLTPTSDSEIMAEVWLPDADQWNG
jgi:feruloyl esterase